MNNSDKKQSLLQNWISVIGGIFSAIWFATIVFLFILDFTAKQHNPYLGVFTYFLFPTLLVISLAAVIFGAWRERKRRVKGVASKKFPVIDFNNPTHQHWAYTIWVVATLFMLCTIVGIYKAYEYTESVAFCGVLCHDVMQPEHVAYQNSPHARVTCVQCHIGPGVGWFVRSKLSGTYQVYSVLAKKYRRPIETPIENLRPAQETCEQCHWPQKFFGAIEKDFQYYLSDEKNSQWKTRMLMFVGGGDSPLAKRGGIHWHMNIKNKVYYVASDDKRQVIPWAKVISPDGEERIYVDEDSEYSADNPPKGEMRLMDCMDCHNRPSHVYKAPDKAVNEAMASGAVDSALPYIKREAVKALTQEYPSHEAGAESIKSGLEKFYQKNYPEIWSGNQGAISQAIQSIVHIYQTNFFPKMKVSWKEYPDNIGHHIFPGCFRCHDEKHKTKDGKILSRDCTVCHAIVEQGPPESTEKSTDGLPFRHPDGDDESWKELNCFDCHTGG